MSNRNYNHHLWKTSPTDPTVWEALLKSGFMWSSFGRGWTLAFQLNGLFHSQSPREEHIYSQGGLSAVWKCGLSRTGVNDALWVNPSIWASGAFFENHCGTSQPPTIDNMLCQTLLVWSVYLQGRAYMRRANCNVLDTLSLLNMIKTYMFKSYLLI